METMLHSEKLAFNGSFKLHYSEKAVKIVAVSHHKHEKKQKMVPSLTTVIIKLWSNVKYYSFFVLLECQVHIPDSVNRFGVQPLSISSAFFLSPFLAFVRVITLLSQPSESDWAPGTEWRQSQQELSFSATVYSTVACSYWNLIHGFVWRLR